MPVLLNKESGLAENLPDANAALAAGTHEIPLVDPQGNPGSATLQDAQELVQQGYTQPKTEQLQSLLKTAKFSGTGEQIKSGLEGLAEGVAGPLAPLTEEALGVKPEDILARKETNPGIHGTGQIVGLVGSSLVGVGEGALLAKAGEGASKLAAKAVGQSALTKLGERVAGRIGIATAEGALKGAVENAIFQAGDEATKMVLHDPSSPETALANVGYSALLGAGIGGTLGLGIGGVSESWKGLSGGKAGQVMADTKARLKEYLDDPHPVDSVTTELKQYLEPLREQAHREVYGATGLKQDELAKLLPKEMTPELKRNLGLEPNMNLYHSSYEDFASNELKPSEKGAFGPGYYFRTEKEGAYDYGDKSHKYEAPSSLKLLNLTNSNGSKEVQKIFDKHGINPGFFLKEKAGTDTFWDAINALRNHFPDEDLVGSNAVNKFHDILKSEGYSGIKYSQGGDNAVLFPEAFSPNNVSKDSDGILGTIKNSLAKMKQNPEEFQAHNVKELERQYGNVLKATESNSPKEIYNALNEFKRYSQGTFKALKRTDSFEIGHKFLTEVKKLGDNVRESLMEPVWGEAGARTKAINKAWGELQTPLKEAFAKFGTKLDGESVIDPGKVNAFFNKLGKPTDEIPKSVLKNVLEAGKKFTKVMDETHANLGIENPLSKASTQAIERTLKKETLGSKLADYIVEKGVGNAIGGAIGGFAGSAVGHPYYGAMVGKAMLGKSAQKAVNALIKPLLDKPINPEAFKAAVDYSTHILEGDKKLSNVIKGVFGASREVLAEPKTEQLEKIKQRLRDVAVNPDLLLKTAGSIGHYLPEHATKLSASAVRAANYLHSLQPITTPLGPLDPPQKPSKMAEAQYNQALIIAEQPMLILEKVRQGSLTIPDITHLRNLYPDLYTKMHDKLMEGIITAHSEGKQIAYKTKLGLSIFMHQPLDASMQPLAIQASQPLPTAPMQPAPTKVAKLDKLPNSYNTMSNSRETSRGQTRH